MAWTTPIRFVSNTVLTAAQLNTTIRDNLLETMPAKATGGRGEYFVTSDFHTIASRQLIARSVFNVVEKTRSSSYTDLATLGPTVSAVTGTNAVVFISAQVQKIAGSDTTSEAVFGVQVQGASDIPPRDDDSAYVARQSNGVTQFTQVIRFTDLTPGKNIFTMKYKVSGDGAYFSRRTITLMPL